MSENLKLKKVNKSFVPEPKGSRQLFRVFSDSYMNIMNVLCMWISWSYFWTYKLHLYKNFTVFTNIFVTDILNKNNDRMSLFLKILFSF